jgi:hypothetical protein
VDRKNKIIGNNLKISPKKRNYSLINSKNKTALSVLKMMKMLKINSTLPAAAKILFIFTVLKILRATTFPIKTSINALFVDTLILKLLLEYSTMIDTINKTLKY